MPTSIPPTLSAARVLLAAGELGAAEELARQALDSGSHAAAAAHLLSRICHAQGRLTETIELWRKARGAGPPAPGGPLESAGDALVALNWAWAPALPSAPHLPSSPFTEDLSERLQEPSAADVFHALGAHPLPLEAVPRAKLSAGERDDLEQERARLKTPGEKTRARAHLALLEGDFSTCERLLRRVGQCRGARWQDFTQLSELAQRRGHFDEALAHALEAARRGALQRPRLWRRILEVLRQGAAQAPVRRLLEEPGVADRVLGASLEEARRSPAEADRWEALAALEELAGRTGEATQHRSKAAALSTARGAGADSGRALVAAVYSLDGEPRGLVHEIHASRARLPPGIGAPGLAILGNVTPELCALTHLVLATVRGFVRAWWPHLGQGADDYLYTVKLTKDDEPSSGASAGLPLACAFLSVLIGRPLPEGVALSGAISCDSDPHVRVRRIGDAEVKVEAALHRGLKAVVLPEENRPDLERALRVPLSRAREVSRHVSTLREAVELLWGRAAWDW